MTYLETASRAGLRYAITDRRALVPDPVGGANVEGDQFHWLHDPVLEAERRRRLLEQAAAWAGAGVDFVQLREKDMGEAPALGLAREVAAALHGSGTRLLINAGMISGRDPESWLGLVDGIHLPAGPCRFGGSKTVITATDLRAIWHQVHRTAVVPHPSQSHRDEWALAKPTGNFETKAVAPRQPTHPDEARMDRAPRACVISRSCHTLAEVQRATGEGVDLILFGPVFGKTVDGLEVVPGVGLKGLAEACRVAQGAPVLALGGVSADRVQGCLDAGAAGVAGIRLFQE